MAGHQDRLSRFWQELKRRRVIHIITVYASASFAIIEIINNLTEPLNLPTSLSTIVIIVLAVGFPLAVILSWLYDLTSGTFIRTKPLDETKEEIKPVVVPNAWKIATYISFVVIVGLVAFNIVTRGNVIKPGMVQSLAILPFDNYTGDENLEYFVSGMHSSLINDMGKVSGLRVLSETTSKLYKNAEKSIPEIALELGVDAVVEAQVLCLGDTICLQVRVVTAKPEEKQLWIGDYREDKRKILSLYNKVTRQIAGEVKVGLTPEEERLLSKSRLVNRDAYDAFLKGQYYWEELDPESISKAVECFELAIELDPDWADPYAGLANTYSAIASYGILPEPEAMDRARKNLNKALELDPNSAHAHYVKALLAVWKDWDWDLGEKEFVKALELNPNHSLARLYYSHLLMILRRTNEAVRQANLGVETDPLKPLILGLYGVVMENEGNYQTALSYYNKALSVDPNNAFTTGNILWVYYDSGEYDKWMDMLKKITKGQWNDEARANVENAFHEKGHIAAIEEMINMNEKFGNEGARMGDGIKLRIYFYIGNYEKVLDYLEKSYENPDRSTAYLGTDFYGYKQLIKYPRYIDLLKKMNLPLPKSD